MVFIGPYVCVLADTHPNRTCRRCMRVCICMCLVRRKKTGPAESRPALRAIVAASRLRKDKHVRFMDNFTCKTLRRSRIERGSLGPTL